MQTSASIRKMDIAAVKNLLAAPKRVVITTHHKPDGDAMGSSLGMYNYLIQLGHQVSVIAPTDYPDFLNWLPGNDTVVRFDTEPATAEEKLLAAEVLFYLDFNASNRVEKFEASMLKSTQSTKIMIDHHLSPTAVVDYMFSFPDASATCELVYDFICAMGHADKINAAVAKCLYTGIMTDTGSFRFASMKPNIHRIVADLMERGAEHYKIHEAIFDNTSEDRLRLLGYTLSNKLRVVPELQAAVVSLNKDGITFF